MGSGPGQADCFKCRHFYVTWDQYFPRGCKALGFKSREMPSLAVFNSSGIVCQKFEAKENNERGSGSIGA